MNKRILIWTRISSVPLHYRWPTTSRISGSVATTLKDVVLPFWFWSDKSKVQGSCFEMLCIRKISTSWSKSGGSSLWVHDIWGEGAGFVHLGWEGKWGCPSKLNYPKMPSSSVFFFFLAHYKGKYMYCSTAAHLLWKIKNGGMIFSLVQLLIGRSPFKARSLYSDLRASTALMLSALFSSNNSSNFPEKGRVAT